jgi:hypothetical protein
MMIPEKEMSLSAIRMRMGMAMMQSTKLPTPECRQIVMNSLSDMPIILKEIEKMAPVADYHGNVVLENEELKERIAMLENQRDELMSKIEELRYERKLREYGTGR